MSERERERRRREELCLPLAGCDGLVFSVLQMTKKIKKLEKETAMYRSRWESSNKALLEMAEEVKHLSVLLLSCSDQSSIYKNAGC